MKKRICVVIASMVFTGALLHAGMTVTPTRQEITLPPGGTYEGSYRVTNGYGKTVEMNVESRYWYVTKEEEKTTKVTDWLTLNKSSFTFADGETVDVKYSVKLSTSMTGMRAAMVSFVPSSKDNEVLTLMISVSLFVTVAGTERPDWDFSDFKITHYQDTTQFSVIVSNNGNVHVRPTGFVKITAGKKQELTLKIPDSRPAYPGQTRQVVAQSLTKEAFPKPGKYSVVFSLNGVGARKEKKYEVKVAKTGEITVTK